MLAFRPFFLLGALFSSLSIAVWGLTFTGKIVFSPLGGSLFWHIHEMLFGFTAAIISGFLLTAVQTWTGKPSIKGNRLFVLVIIWLCARVFFAIPHLIPEPIIIILDLCFLPMTAFYLAIPIIRAKLWRNLFFVPILLIMTLLNGLMYLSNQGTVETSLVTLSHTMVMLITLVLCIMAGRVIPMFTANGTQTKRVSSIGWLEKSSIISIVVCFVLSFEILTFNSYLIASFFIFSGLLNFFRAIRWRIWITFKTPLIWSLHISYFAIPIGLTMIGLHHLKIISNLSLPYHALTVGGIGLMVLSMISRVSLGHTARLIKSDIRMTLAFIFLLLAFITRVLAPLLFNQYFVLILISSFFWVLAYTLFVLIYLPILLKPRIDGNPG
jgi:uncharacterized protein involved in response to NO